MVVNSKKNQEWDWEGRNAWALSKKRPGKYIFIMKNANLEKRSTDQNKRKHKHDFVKLATLVTDSCMIDVEHP